jgi:hypothetical protein
MGHRGAAQPTGPGRMRAQTQPNLGPCKNAPAHAHTNAGVSEIKREQVCSLVYWLARLLAGQPDNKAGRS